MSPELATRTTDPDTQPLPRRDPGTTLDALVAELAVAEKWPTPEGYCHRCSGTPCCSAKYCDTVIYPLTLDGWGIQAATAALEAVGLPSWHGDPAMLRALAGNILARIAV